MALAKKRLATSGLHHAIRNNNPDAYEHGAHIVIAVVVVVVAAVTVVVDRAQSNDRNDFRVTGPGPWACAHRTRTIFLHAPRVPVAGIDCKNVESYGVTYGYRNACVRRLRSSETVTRDTGWRVCTGRRG